MAVRHEVENLIRRGNIFYWRARIPAAFLYCRPGSRLSLSLHCSDHKKAQIIGRTLNTRLAELKMNSKEVMTTKQQLQKLFEHIRDGMLGKLEDISLMAKRDGRAGHVSEMELDLVAGWAYRLLAKFGARRPLPLEGDCIGLKYLLKHGVPVSHIDAIRANHVDGLKVAANPAVEAAVRNLMVSFGIPDDVVNRERAMTKFFEARSDALFDIDHRHELVDRSLSDFFGGSQVTESTLEPAAATTSPLATYEEVLERPPIQSTQEELPEIAHLDLSPSQPVLQATTRLDAEPSRRAVAVADFEDECQKLIANMGVEWVPATARDAMALVRTFKSVLLEHGVEHSGQIEQYHLGMLRQHFNDIPTHWGKSSRMRGMTAPELRAEGRLMREKAEAEGKKPEVGLSAATIRKHLGNLTHFMKHLRGHGYVMDEWTLVGLRPRKPNASLIREQQYKPTPQDIAPIFSSPIYVGSRDFDRGRKKHGPKVFHDSVYFLPLLFTYLGARRKEFAGLSVSDIERDEDGFVIVIRSNEIRRLKNGQSKRVLPLPDELVRLGFIQYQTAIKKLGYEALFPDLFSDKTDNDPGDRFYDIFTPIMRGALGENMWERALHALRHGMADTLKQAGVPAEVIDDISGRISMGSETNMRYTNPAGIPLMRSALAKYPIITSVIEPKSLQLLPWIADRQPPPWARGGKK